MGSGCNFSICGVSLLVSSAFDVELFADWSSEHEITSKLIANPGISVFNTVLNY
jgi:hypothetical protein